MFTGTLPPRMSGHTVHKQVEPITDGKTSLISQVIIDLHGIDFFLNFAHVQSRTNLISKPIYVYREQLALSKPIFITWTIRDKI